MRSSESSIDRTLSDITGNSQRLIISALMYHNPSLCYEGNWPLWDDNRHCFLRGGRSLALVCTTPTGSSYREFRKASPTIPLRPARTSIQLIDSSQVGRRSGTGWGLQLLLSLCVGNTLCFKKIEDQAPFPAQSMDERVSTQQLPWRLALQA
jgi:hypothetical protein